MFMSNKTHVGQQSGHLLDSSHWPDSTPMRFFNYNSMKTTCRPSLSDLFILCCCFWCTTYGIVIDGHICQTTNADYRLSFSANFSFPFAENNRKFAVLFFRLQQTNESESFPLVLFFISIYKLKWEHIYRLPLSVYHFLILQTEVCSLSVCLGRNKGKFSVCKRTKWMCLSMGIICKYWIVVN